MKKITMLLYLLASGVTMAATFNQASPVGLRCSKGAANGT